MPTAYVTVIIQTAGQSSTTLTYQGDHSIIDIQDLAVDFLKTLRNNAVQPPNTNVVDPTFNKRIVPLSAP